MTNLAHRNFDSEDVHNERQADDQEEGEHASDYDARFERGMRVLKKMGRENLMLNQKALYPDLYEMSVGHLFGDVWGRPGLSLRERQLVTLAANIALGARRAATTRTTSPRCTSASPSGRSAR